jgi:hypothetical protein
MVSVIVPMETGLAKLPEASDNWAVNTLSTLNATLAVNGIVTLAPPQKAEAESAPVVITGFTALYIKPLARETPPALLCGITNKSPNVKTSEPLLLTNLFPAALMDCGAMLWAIAMLFNSKRRKSKVIFCCIFFHIYFGLTFILITLLIVRSISKLTPISNDRSV